MTVVVVLEKSQKAAGIYKLLGLHKIVFTKNYDKSNFLIGSSC